MDNYHSTSIKKLEESGRLLEENHELANNTIDMLVDQNYKLKNIKNRNDMITENTVISRNKITSIIRTELKSSWIKTASIILAILIIIILIILIGVKHKN